MVLESMYVTVRYGMVLYRLHAMLYNLHFEGPLCMYYIILKCIYFLFLIINLNF